VNQALVEVGRGGRCYWQKDAFRLASVVEKWENHSLPMKVLETRPIAVFETVPAKRAGTSARGPDAP
jgi:hypothetical protein